MTNTVKITHEGPGPEDIRITTVDRDGEEISGKLLTKNSSTSILLHSGASIRIEEASDDGGE